jgi:hypothetical protein
MPDGLGGIWRFGLDVEVSRWLDVPHALRSEISGTQDTPSSLGEVRRP